MTIDSLPTSSGGEALEAAAYPARAVSIIDIGNQDGPYGVKRQLIVQFELPTEQSEDDEGKPRARFLSYFVNVPESYGPKSKLFQLVEVMGLKKGETLADMLGKACSVDVGVYTKDGNDKNRINSVNKLSKGMDVAKPITTPLMVSEDDWDNVDDLGLQDWIVTLIKERVA